MNVSIRPAKSTDLEHLVSLTKDTITRNYTPFMSDEGVKFIIKSEYYDSFISANLASITVVEVNDGVRGFIIAQENKIALMMVDTDVHGYGAGSFMLKNLEKNLSGKYEEVFCEIHDGNTKAVAFFERRGFSRQKEIFDPIAKQNIITLVKNI